MSTDFKVKSQKYDCTLLCTLELVSVLELYLDHMTKGHSKLNVH